MLRPDGTRLSDEHEECRLEGVLGVVAIPEDPRQTPNTIGGMPKHKDLERFGIPAVDERFQQLRIGRLAEPAGAIDLRVALRLWTGEQERILSARVVLVPPLSNSFPARKSLHFFPSPAISGRHPRPHRRVVRPAPPKNVAIRAAARN